MDKHPPEWSKGSVFLCEKCGRRKDGVNQNERYAEEWKGDFKAAMKHEGLAREVRVMVGGCLDLCPEGQAAAAWCPADGKTEIWAFTLDEKNDILDLIKQKARS